MCVRCGTGRVAWCTSPDRHAAEEAEDEADRHFWAAVTGIAYGLLLADLYTRSVDGGNSTGRN